ncbi:hypothetical protein SADUNF_Sadunf13G0017200 [Salix dunnii]|uniref:Protein kinase domain-containing protein n=1 Tax=Salix dunnii TaxID=1413687 RepID=A0A835JGR4_9ROSI|nr:hypothetical protein SADUNF_Sadunf13G0017200 [Salix dunnii]
MGMWTPPFDGSGFFVVLDGCNVDDGKMLEPEEELVIKMVLEEGIMKTKMIVEGNQEVKFTTEECQRCVFDLHSASYRNNSHWLLERFVKSLEESINSAVLPSFVDKHDALLLREFILMWSNYKLMTKWLCKFFESIDRHFVPKICYCSLTDISNNTFHDLVFKDFYVKFQDVALSLINQERMGLHIDCSSLKNVFLVFMEMHKHTGITYYEGFESVMLEQTSNYYCQMAQQWLSHGSPADYVQKVYWCLEQEAERAGRYLPSGTQPKLLKVVKQQLVYDILHKLVVKQRPGNCSFVTDFYQHDSSRGKLLDNRRVVICSVDVIFGFSFVLVFSMVVFGEMYSLLSLTLTIGGMTTCWETNKDKKVNKETAFIRNGSKLLEKLVDICDGKCNSIRSFSATELEKATSNYDPRKVLTSDSGYKLYKGFLQGRPVSIKKFKDDDEQSKIAMDMANAVAFLHAAFAKPIVFRNIKPSNILLDDNHEAKLSDFSISISIPEGESHARDVVIAGAFGLIAPECFTTGNFNEKQDVFNFGVFLLVLLSGQTVNDFSRPEEEILLQDHVKKCIEDDRLNEVIDSTIIAEGAWTGKEQQLQAFAALALRCISEEEEDRPSMIDVSKELRKIHRSAISCQTAFIRNGSKLLEKLVDICDGKCNSIRRFSATELEKTTSNYDPLKLLTEDSGYKLPVSVKKFDDGDQHYEYCFNDIVYSSKMSVHKSFVKLLGCCLETQNPILVFEYVGHRTLGDCLWGSEEARCRPLLWIPRSKIAMDMANAVAFLHAAFARPIVFRNINPSNILLDDNHEAKLSDFSYSISIPEGDSHVRDVAIIGASGLIAPEYWTTGDFNEKLDVFNFGGFLLTLLSGQKLADYSRPEEEIFLQNHVEKCIEDDRLNEVIDSTIIAEGAWPRKEQQLQAFAALALRCISEKEEDRPSMIDVSKELRKIHRLYVNQDIKPSKIISDENYVPKLIDFSLFIAIRKVSLIIGGMTTCWGTKKDKKVNKETAFIRNGSKLLENLVHICNGKCNSIRRFSATELQKATNNYDPRKLLTRDSGYKLYKGFLQGRPVSVKKFKDGDKEYEHCFSDVVYASKMSVHKSFVKLLGCCLETQIPILVFEYVGDRTLRDCLRGFEDAVVGLCYGSQVAFLHAAFARPIVFRNFKPSNILLDDNHEAKLSDFSYSISIPEGESHVRDVDITGTLGLIAPEYFNTGNFNEKQDVFNFCGFLLMLLSGQTLFDYSRAEEEIFLLNHVEKCIEDDMLNKVIDSTILAEEAWPGKEQQLQAFAALAPRCISDVAEDRPSMIDVSKELRKIHQSAISCRQRQG